LNEVHLIAGLIVDYVPFLLILVEFGYFLPVIEPEQTPIEKLVVLLNEALLGFTEVGVVEPPGKIGPNRRQSLFPADVVARVKQHPRFTHAGTELPHQPLLVLVHYRLLDEHEEREKG
jgi:hypothetical protein